MEAEDQVRNALLSSNNMILGLGVVGALTAIGIYYRTRLSKRWGRHDTTNEVNVAGKIIIVTGASSGLGKEVTKELVRRGATVILACRTIESGKSTIEDILRNTKEFCNGVMVPMALDLSSLDSVRNFVKSFSEKFSKLDILINNAGVFVQHKKKELTKDGFEINFGVNHLGHFLLTNLLVAHLKKAAPSRIVIISSLRHAKGELRLEDLNLKQLSEEEEARVSPYNNSKLANAYFARELANRLAGTGVHTYAVMPGFVKTNLHRNMSIKWYHYILLLPVYFFLMRTPNQGCQTILHCALSEEAGTETGKLYRDCKVFVSPHSFSESASKKLWEKSFLMTGLA